MWILSIVVLVLVPCCICIISAEETAPAASLADLMDERGTEKSCGCGAASRNDVQPEELAHSLLSDSLDYDEFASHDIRLSYKTENFKEDMVYIPGGRTFVGTNTPILKSDGEGPMRPVTLSSYFVDRFSVTNDDFFSFVKKTGFVTEGEKFGWSFVFHSAIPPNIKQEISQAVLGAEWWLPVNGSYWREPEAPGIDVFETNREKHPVVQVSWNDAVAYCNWRNSRLPTEAEWEVAARGPHLRQPKQELPLFPWGNKLVPKGVHRMNVFQGKFPVKNAMDDGWEFTSPVDAFGPQNDYGVYNMIGNVWEWVSDWFSTDHVSTHQFDPTGPLLGTQKVKKGGSFLCHRSYCYRYRTVARFPSTPDSGTLNIGFRCARSATADEIALHEQAIKDDSETDESDEL